MDDANTDYAEAIMRLGERIDRAIGADLVGLTDQDVVKELRRIADEIEESGI